MLVSVAIENSFYYSALDLARVEEYTLRNFEDNCELHWKRKVASTVDLFVVIGCDELVVVMKLKWRWH